MSNEGPRQLLLMLVRIPRRFVLETADPRVGSILTGIRNWLAEVKMDPPSNIDFCLESPGGDGLERGSSAMVMIVISLALIHWTNNNNDNNNKDGMARGSTRSDISPLER